MRRSFALVALGMALVLAGCASGPPPGTDGNVVDDWSALPEPQVLPPAAVGTCHDYRGANFGYYLTSSYTIIDKPDSSVTRDCVTNDTLAATSHDTETAYVGAFTGADAALAAPPAVASASRRAAYAHCLTSASAYLGGDWHQAPVWILLVLPTDAAWHGGARWFRCDLGHLDNVSNRSKITHGSIRGGLTGTRPLAITCMTTVENDDGSILNATAIGCDKPHAAEYAGSYTATTRTWPADDDDQSNLGQNGCREVVAHYLGFSSSSAWYGNDIGYWEMGFYQEAWELGDRSTRCFAYAFTKSKVMIGSVKGIKNKKPKS